MLLIAPPEQTSSYLTSNRYTDAIIPMTRIAMRYIRKVLSIRPEGWRVDEGACGSAMTPSSSFLQ